MRRTFNYYNYNIYLILEIKGKHLNNHSTKFYSIPSKTTQSRIL